MIFYESSHSQSPLISRTYGAENPNAVDTDKPVLVMLHGWGLNSGVWHSVIPLLAEHFTVISIDLPGFGTNSRQLPKDYSLAHISEWVSACIPMASIVLGWSMGGLVAQHIALQAPEKVKRLVTVASTPCFEQKADWHGIKPNVLNAFEQQLEADFGKTLARFLAIQALGSPSAKADIKQIQRHVRKFSAPSPVALLAGLQLLSSVDLRHTIASISCPTLRIYGRLDSLVPADGIPLIQALQPDCVSKIIQHAAHAPFISHPREWVELIVEFGT
ncbi:pimeloyl-ACP methyl ester esterase BioH [Alteromonas sp. ASW11-36]|uniref:Pimeloyl-[acyl-carrier protein] methyl ester esterase n=1 Tax=Alteromonas arenosi TaxID=3055817 RepID=A0ABT7T0U6_9ALTE|nr:pimeloyl-ACP methyl ester esterase BioH [Alteromonas sp. ASW11-36]MDM7862055.1 pimeloyl-ACP methyl ester esterase BioH [Alteromonas sp. ASW11-36]